LTMEIGMERGSAPALIKPKHRVSADLLPYGIVGLALIVVPPLLPDYFQSLLVKVLIFSVFAMSLDLIMGYTGLPSLGHAAYFGLAGYIAAILILKYQIDSFWVVLSASLFGATLLAATFGPLALRVRGIYFLLVTLALGQLLFYVAWYWRSMTGGDDGLVGKFTPHLGIPGVTWGPLTFYYFVLILFAISFFVMRWVAKLPFGLSLKGLEENELRMRCLGYNTWAIKYVVFIIGSLFAGVAGVLFVYFNGFAVPKNLGIHFSGLVMFMVILGGAGTLWGSAIGAAVILYLEYISSVYFPARWPLVFGTAFILTAMFVKGGLAPYLIKIWERAVRQWRP
jgi:branched-chain amino acid transport system permease protein